MNFCALLFSRNAKEPACLRDAPRLRLGRHLLIAENIETDGGAAACAFGRLRNERELRSRLAAAGLDGGGGLSGLTLGAYRLYGEDFPMALEGPVSAVVVDQDAGRLIASRDRMGQTRLFYAARGGSVAVSDHPEPLLDAGFASRAVDLDGLRELFALGPARTPGRTPFRDILSLEPGCALFSDGRGQKARRYFALKAMPHEDDPQKTVRRVRELAERALEPCLGASPGVMLSGGLDSSILAALLARALPEPVRGYSVVYEDDEKHFRGNDYQIDRDEAYIRAMAEFIGAEERYISLGARALYDSLDEAMALRGFPGMADVDSSLLLFSREIAKSEGAVISGECADEMFGGYPWFHREELILSESFPWSGSLALRERVLKKPIREKLKLAEYAAARYHEACMRQPRLSGEAPREARLRQLHGLCLSWFMPNLQERAARMAAGAGLEILTPFADERLAQYAFNIPWAVKNMGGREKGVLRAATEDLLPEKLLLRKKSPYPKTHNPDYARLAAAGVRALLRDFSAPINKLIDGDAVCEIMESGLASAAAPWFGQLMTGPQLLAYLIQLDRWMRRYKAELAI